MRKKKISEKRDIISEMIINDKKQEKENKKNILEKSTDIIIELLEKIEELEDRVKKLEEFENDYCRVNFNLD
jgi:hypothetical protein